ncbi:MAG: MBL fold metallo-hydrolase [Clostridiales bacterium]|nr:MBL fold metallo-hydrolase [Clostridiales bacterium]
MMIKVLSDNRAASDTFGQEHGLSLYVKTRQHRLLFDTGATSLFADNAARLGVNLPAVDIAFLSHGHYDHGGGLETFLEINDKAKVYMQKEVFEPYYAKSPEGNLNYIGLDTGLLPNERFVFCGQNEKIDDELELLSKVGQTGSASFGSRELYRKSGEALLPDDFSHEQNLIIWENGRSILITGCAHQGILNIVQQFKLDKGCFPDLVIGGFHLHSRGSGKSEDPEALDAIARELLETGSLYYCCHCTGQEAYLHLKSIMGNKISYLSAGSRLAVNL